MASCLPGDLVRGRAGIPRGAKQEKPARSKATGDATAKWQNPVRQYLREGKPVIGGTVTVSSVDVAAHMANMGFDFLWVEMEHSPISWETFRNMVLATRGLKAMPFFRVPANEVWAAKRGLDAGALGVIFPFTSTPELARQAVASCKYPPEGKRGAGPGLASFRWPTADESYYEFANRNVMVIAIIEDKSGVDHIEEIAAVPGIDVLFIGTNDLSWQLTGGKKDAALAGGHRQDRRRRQAARQVPGPARRQPRRRQASTWSRASCSSRAPASWA